MQDHREAVAKRRFFAGTGRVVEGGTTAKGETEDSAGTQQAVNKGARQGKLDGDKTDSQDGGARLWDYRQTHRHSGATKQTH